MQPDLMAALTAWFAATLAAQAGVFRLLLKLDRRLTRVETALCLHPKPKESKQ